MAAAVHGLIVEELNTLGVEFTQDSILEKLSDLSSEYNLDPSSLCEEWVAFSQQNHSCSLDFENLEKFEGSLRKKPKTPLARRGVSKNRVGKATMYTKDDLPIMFRDNDILGQYATPEDSERLKSQKRAVEVTTPTTPANKMRHTQNGPTPISKPHPHSNGTTPTNGHSHHNSHITPGNSTPGGSYSQRRTAGRVVVSLNDCTVPVSWRGEHREVVARQLGDNPLRESSQYLFQKVTEKAFILMERIQNFGQQICQHNNLSDPLSLNESSTEPAVFTGQVVCEGEGHLNARSCLLEGIGGANRRRGACVRMVIPDNVQCSLFPGQVVAVEGLNSRVSECNILTAVKIHDEGVPPPLFTRTDSSITGFTLLSAVGPFTTSDSLDLQPLTDLLEVVRRDSPHFLLLMGPFVDSTHQQIKSCQVPGDLTFKQFFEEKIIHQIMSACSGRSKVILIPSQRDIHHPYAVYPQPPLHTSHAITSFPDPTTLTVNGLCVGVTSSDVLFHLSARTMFKGSVGDRMARLASHILQQRCYYPLLPAFRRDDHTIQPTPSTDTPNRPSKLSNQIPVAMEADNDTTELNINFIDAYEKGHALLPVRPDVLILPSDLKPFIKVLDGCVCVNPGRLTKKTTGGTFMKMIVPDLPPNKADLTKDIGVQIVHV